MEKESYIAAYVLFASVCVCVSRPEDDVRRLGVFSHLLLPTEPAHLLARLGGQGDLGIHLSLPPRTVGSCWYVLLCLAFQYGC